MQYKLQEINRELPTTALEFSKADLEANFEKIYKEAKSIFDWNFLSENKAY
ncbi:hypothetical protein [Arenibacter latericius]|uniref:hypothetical protein n=1 Tax=Arenibacter latericius TaxID=86104 RepID=UPI00040E0B3F|nr:hypothetical protein [Arenibacter latericius]